MQSQPYIIANGGPSLIVGAKSAICLGIARIITGSLILLLAIITVPLLGWRNYRGFIILSGVVVSPVCKLILLLKIPSFDSRSIKQAP